MYASVEVEANSLKEALKEVDDGVSLPDNGEYVDGSFEVSVEE